MLQAPERNTKATMQPLGTGQGKTQSYKPQNLSRSQNQKTILILSWISFHRLGKGSVKAWHH